MSAIERFAVTGQLETLEQARQLLALAGSPQEVKRVADFAEAMRYVAQQAEMGLEAQNEAAELKLDAQRKGGAMLAGRVSAGNPQLLSDSIIKLGDVGITPYESMNWQCLGRIPEDKYEHKKAEIRADNKELTTAALVRYGRALDRGEAAQTPPPEGTYRVLYADPPWQYGDTREGLKSYGPAEKFYPTMSTRELMDMPVSELADENAVLFMWATSPMLPDALQVLEAWGFVYKSSFVWDKVRHNFGHYNSVRHELLLIGTRGSCLPDSGRLFDSVVAVDKTSIHSQKPPIFREMIDELYTWGPRIELFLRGDAPDGWAGWGNEAA